MEMDTMESMASFPENQKSSYMAPKERVSIQMRLNRIEGQVRGVQRQVERDEYCDKIFNQLEAVHSALNAVGVVLMSHHLKAYAANTGLKNNNTIADEMLRTLTILVMRRDEEK
ncbi:metal-sensitive transcriptional regulator [Paenibacillus sp. NPDC058071]|uniref:metal-sensitive transcriptional regulator n=1 Tax=Paenibacillus sp. NPDC058071 TaxID=3346326 RepID=UPI0036D8D784